MVHRPFLPTCDSCTVKNSWPFRYQRICPPAGLRRSMITLKVLWPFWQPAQASRPLVNPVCSWQGPNVPLLLREVRFPQ